MNKATLCAGVLLALATSTALAEDFDGSKKLICAPVDAHDCVEGARCLASTPDAIGAPAFLRVDVPKKLVHGAKRDASIETVTKGEHQLLLKGTEQEFAWTMAIDRDSGKMTLSYIDRAGAYVLFGACTTL